MAQFLKSYSKTAQSEGGYSNNSNDKGGETYKGISRKYNPYWSGWQYIDAERNNPNFSQILESKSILQGHVLSFYTLIWDTLHGDEIQSQLLADRLFDITVNMGMKDAISFIQRSLNVLNKQQKLWPDLIVDGNLGPKTLAIITQRDEKEGNIIAKGMLILQGCHYFQILEKDPTQEVFAWGWLNRIPII